MTLPALTPCPKPECRAPITHWHGGDGDLYACTSALNGRPCPHDDAGETSCYAPRATSPLHQPDVDTVARKIYESDCTIPWGDRDDSVKDSYRANARAVLDLIAAHQPVWQRVEPGTLVKEGTHYRIEYGDGRANEHVASFDRTVDDSAPVFIDTRTVPTPTLTERIRAALDDSPESRITLDVADVEALLDMVGGEGK